MKRTLLLISAVTVFAALLGAQDDAAYTAAMKSVAASANGRMAPLRVAVMNKDVAAAAAEATKVAAGFDVILSYWKAKNVDDAVKLAATAHDAAKTIADSKDADAQAAALMTLNGTCGQCHMAHRAGAGGAFTIK